MNDQDQWSIRTVSFVYAPLYLLMVGVLYLWGFWGTYHVNVLEHAGISDVVKAAAQPVTSSFMVWIFGALLGLSMQAPAGESAADSKTQRFKVQRRHVILGVCMVIMGIAAYMTSHVIASMFLPIAAVWLTQRYMPTALLSGLIRDETARRFVVWTVVALPPFAFAHGLMQADLIKGARTFQYLATPIEMVSEEVEHFSMSPRLLGRVGGDWFFYLPASEDLVIVRSDLISDVHLRRFDAGYKGRFGKAEKPTVTAVEPTPIPAPQ